MYAKASVIVENGQYFLQVGEKTLDPENPADLPQIVANLSNPIFVRQSIENPKTNWRVREEQATRTVGLLNRLSKKDLEIIFDENKEIARTLIHRGQVKETAHFLMGLPELMQRKNLVHYGALREMLWRGGESVFLDEIIPALSEIIQKDILDKRNVAKVSGSSSYPEFEARVDKIRAGWTIPTESVRPAEKQEIRQHTPQS